MSKRNYPRSSIVGWPHRRSTYRDGRSWSQRAGSSAGSTFSALPDGSLLAGGNNSSSDTYTFVVRTKATGITAVRVEALGLHPSMVRGGPGKGCQATSH